MFFSTLEVEYCLDNVSPFILKLRPVGNQSYLLDSCVSATIWIKSFALL